MFRGLSFQLTLRLEPLATSAASSPIRPSAFCSSSRVGLVSCSVVRRSCCCCTWGAGVLSSSAASRSFFSIPATCSLARPSSSCSASTSACAAARDSRSVLSSVCVVSCVRPA
ncbi:hypothetical protein BD779DRAFT_1540373 [Infundibulicybe gibba]|nr:hypothetical protein BD779DRAFT_1540373 [Infundibulicybe gibba]